LSLHDALPIYVEVEQLPHADNGAAVGETSRLKLRREFPDGLRRRLRSNRAEESAIRLPQQVKGARRQRIALRAPEIPTDIAAEVVGLEARGVEDQTGGIADLRADAIARQPGYTVSRHGFLLWSMYLRFR